MSVSYDCLSTFACLPFYAAREASAAGRSRRDSVSMSFDAIVSIDSWEDFGTADSYLPHLLTEMVTVTAARLQPNGWHDWLRWIRVPDPDRTGYDRAPYVEMLEADRGEFVSFALMAAREITGG